MPSGEGQKGKRKSKIYIRNCKICKRDFECRSYKANRCFKKKCQRERNRSIRAAQRAENPELDNEKSRKWRLKCRASVILVSARARAKKAKVPFDLAVEDIVFPKTCPVLGMNIERQIGRVKDNSPTLDRLVPSKGYVRGNVMIISHRANRLKSDATIEEMRMILKYLENHLDLKKQLEK